MIANELVELINEIRNMKCERQTIEVKAAHEGCPEKLYDTISSFSNQDAGGIFVFGLDERNGFAPVGVYDAYDLQKKVMEYCEQMTPIVRPVFTVCEIDGLTFVSAEIPPVDITDRPCFKSGKGRLKGSYIRVGDADKPMTEYEVYSYEAYRKKYQDDIRPVERASVEALDQIALEEYLLRRKKNRPNLAALSKEQLYELTSIQRDGQVTLSAVMLFSPYPQAYFPQLGIIATRVPGREMGELNSSGQRFLDSKRIEGTVPDMLDGALAFVENNMQVSTSIDSKTGKRRDIPQYPMDAVREAILNALVHRDYSMHTEGMPIQLTMYADRLEISNPGGLYGRLTLDQLGKAQPDTRNPVLVTAMEALGKTENRYSGIPRIRHAMAEANLPEPVFANERGTFSVQLMNEMPQIGNEVITPHDPTEDLIEFCKTPRKRQEIADFMGIASVGYAINKYVKPLVDVGVLKLTYPNKPKSSKQMYYSE